MDISKSSVSDLIKPASLSFINERIAFSLNEKEDMRTCAAPVKAKVWESSWCKHQPPSGKNGITESSVITRSAKFSNLFLKALNPKVVLLNLSFALSG